MGRGLLAGKRKSKLRQHLKCQRFLQLLLLFGWKAADPDLNESAAALHGKPDAAAAVGNVVGVIPTSPNRVFAMPGAGVLENLKAGSVIKVAGGIPPSESRPAAGA